MSVLKHIKTVLPLPKEWEKDEDRKRFGLRIEQAIRELFSKRVTGVKAGGKEQPVDKNGNVVLNVANNLTTTAAGSVLDARQGKALNDAKLNKTDVKDSLSITDTGYALDAVRGKQLKDAVDGKIDLMPAMTSVAASATENISLSNSQRYLIICEGTAANTRTAIIASVSSTGTVAYTQLVAASALTISYSTNLIKVKNTSSYAVRVYRILLSRLVP